MDQRGFFEVEDRLSRLSDLGDQLEAFSRAVDFERFRPDLERAVAYSDGRKGGRPPIDPVLMFKVLVIQTINTLWDERTEYLINDRVSFMRFLGLSLSDRVPDAKTIWLFRCWKATDASAHDGARLREGLLDRSHTGSDVRADTAYRSRASERFMERYGFVSGVHHKKPPHRDMPVRTRRSNAGKSVIRSRVEHVFADQKSRMGLFVRPVGIKRAEMKIGLANLVYNIRRFLYLERINAT